MSFEDFPMNVELDLFGVGTNVYIKFLMVRAIIQFTFICIAGCREQLYTDMLSLSFGCSLVRVTTAHQPVAGLGRFHGIMLLDHQGGKTPRNYYMRTKP